MKIVMAANWWYRRGGLGAVMLDEARELAAAGHTVIPFASAHPSNIRTPWSTYFPPFSETADLGRSMSGIERVRTAVRLLSNSEAARCFDQLLAETRPDIVHLHNTARQLSPSILRIATERKIPILLTVHDYSLICPQGQMYKGEQSACTPPNCTNGNTAHAVLNRCVKRSLAGSSLAAAEHLIHRALRLYIGRAKFLLCPSRFVAGMLMGAGVSPSQLRIIPNGVASLPEVAELPASGRYILYAGRLSREKGLRVLLAAAKLTPDVKYVIAGDGPLLSELESHRTSNVTLTGHVSELGVAELLRECVALVSPSTWYENAPISILEALRGGRPVIASEIGGQGELLRGGGGILVQPGRVLPLVNAIRGVWESPAEAKRLGVAAAANFEKNFTLAIHMERLQSIYHEAIGA
jgi:glycosyltransferase involved in cell wall biosynthesis